MKASLPSLALTATFTVLVNALLLSGLIRYGNDTSHADIPFRSLASALISQGDFPLWYPGGGNGFPQLSLQWISWVANPLGIAISVVRPYDYLSLAVENVVWRAVGFAGAFVFARHWTISPLGATVVAATYVGSGVMSWAALSYSALIGQMFAPWVLASGSLAIRASSFTGLLRSAGVFALSYGLMVWCAYPGAWISAPVLSGPILFALGMTARGGPPRLFSAIVVGAILSASVISIVLSETTSVSLIEGSVIYSRVSPGMREGLLRGVDLAGLLLPNPSYFPGVSSATLHPLYSGTLPVLLLVGTFAPLRGLAIPLTAACTAMMALVMANFQNWTLWDHPLLREISSVKPLANISDELLLVTFIIAPAFIISLGWGKSLPLHAIDKVFLAGISWVLVVSGDNLIANFLRFNIPPFVLVRYNHLYFWLVTLLIATFAWRRIEQIISTPNFGNYDPVSVRDWGLRIPVIGLASLIVTAFVGLTTHDAHGDGAPTNGFSEMGSPHLAWQGTIVMIGLLTGAVALWLEIRRPTGIKHLVWKMLAILTISSFILLCISGVLIRHAGIHPPTIAVTFSQQLLLDISHVFFVLGIASAILFRARSQSYLRAGLAIVMVLDVSLAVPRYFSDNDTAGAAQPGWPFPPFKAGRAGEWFLPQSTGLSKTDFFRPFTGSTSPPPPVSRLQSDWGTLYDTWVHFPSSWSPILDADVLVARDNLADGARPIGCSTTQQASPMTPTGSVSLLLATTVEVPFTADCDRLLVFTDSWAPGWSATIDGVPTPVLRVNNAIRGVMVPAGEHALQWRYRPRFLAPLLGLLVAGLGISGILIAAPWWSRRFPISMSPRLDQLFSFGAPTPETNRVQMIGPVDFNTPVPTVAPGSRDVTGREGYGPRTNWRYGLPIALPLTGLAILVLASVTAYDPRIDGPTQGFRLFLFRSVLAGLWAWIVIAGRTGFRSPVGPSLMVLVLLPPLALQVARHTYPIQAGTPLATIATDFRSPSWQSTWEVTHRGNAPGDPGSNGTILRNDGPNAMAITFATTPIPKDLWPWWRRPLGKTGPGPLDVTWTASLDRSGPYYTVATLGRLTIQALKNGYLVTAPVPGGDVRGDFLEVPDTGQPGPVRWLLHIEPDAGASLSLDDRQVWKGGHPGVIERITLGDASNDPEHRGSMTVTDALIVQRVALTAQ